MDVSIQHAAGGRPVLFISDLHLDQKRPQIVALFLQFLQRAVAEAEALYILGDFFEAWIGDDAVTGDEPPLAAMRQATAGGLRIYVMRGNRDFLLGSRFEQLTGATLLPDPVVIDLHGTPTLLMHGDLLCTDDHHYQQFRAMVHNPEWQESFLSKTIPERIAMAQAARSESSERNQAIDDYLMDVNQQTVEQTLRSHGVQQLIHGHTHRPAVHDFELDGRPVKRIVLGDWYDQGSRLQCRDGVCKLEAIPLSA